MISTLSLCLPGESGEVEGAQESRLLTFSGILRAKRNSLVLIFFNCSWAFKLVIDYYLLIIILGVILRCQLLLQSGDSLSINYLVFFESQILSLLSVKLDSEFGLHEPLGVFMILLQSLNLVSIFQSDFLLLHVQPRNSFNHLLAHLSLAVPITAFL